METANNNHVIEFTPNCVYSNFVQGKVSHFIAQYEISKETGRPALIWVDGFGWATKEITEEEYISLKGEMVIANNPVANNGFFTLKVANSNNTSNKRNLANQVTKSSFDFISQNFKFEKVSNGIFGKNAYGDSEWIKYFPENGAMSYSPTGSVRDVVVFNTAQKCIDYIQKKELN